MSDAALALIRQFEGFRETPYWDVNALRTGYGSDTITTADGKVIPVDKGTRVTREDADRDLARRVNTEFLPRVVAQIGDEAFARLTDAQKAALASIAYNYGELPDSVVGAVKSGGDVVAAISGLAGHNGGVNKDRRLKEAAVFGGSESLPDYAGGAAQGRYQPPGNEAMPQLDENPTRLEWAYRNGKMTPEDAAIYERGKAAGAYQPPQPQQPKQIDPADVYRAAVGNMLPNYSTFGGLRS